MAKGEKKEKKAKKAAADAEDVPETSGRDPRELCSVIAKPMADPKMLKKLLKLTKKAAKRKQLKLGVKEVLKAVRKGTAGCVVACSDVLLCNTVVSHRICIIAGDISPIDVISPLPVLCEDHSIPYIYAPSKEVRTLCDVCVAALQFDTHQELGHAGLTKRSASCVLVLDKPLKGGSGEDAEEFKEMYTDVLGRVKSQQILYNVR